LFLTADDLLKTTAGNIGPASAQVRGDCPELPE
jgi:hypothetical protein